MEAYDLDALAKNLSRQRLTPIGTPSKEGAFASTRFSKLATFNHGGVFVGRFTGKRRGNGIAKAMNWFTSSSERSISRC